MTDGHREHHRAYRSAGRSAQGAVPAVQPGDLPVAAVLARDLLRAALPDHGAADSAAEASRFKAESEQAIAAYEKALADARTRAQTIASETRDRLQAEADRNRKSLEEQLNARLAEAEKTIAATKSAAMANVRGIATEAAAAIVTRLTGVAAPDAKVTAAVDAVLKR